MGKVHIVINKQFLLLDFLIDWGLLSFWVTWRIVIIIRIF